MIEPGDAVLADDNGMLVMKPHEIAETAMNAVDVQRAEQTRLARSTTGGKRPEFDEKNARSAEIMTNEPRPRHSRA